MKTTKLLLTCVLFAANLFVAKAEKDLLLKNNDVQLLTYKKKSPILLDKQEMEVSVQQVVKLNLFQLPLLNFSLQYECAVHKNISAALGFSFLMPRGIPNSIYEPSQNANGFLLPKFKGWSVTPEFRFYPGKKEEHQAPHGFYLAPYFRYSKYSISGQYLNYSVDTNGVTHDDHYTMKASYYGFTGGLMMGSQWIIGEHFSIDWWIFGFGAGKAKFQIDATSTDGSIYLNASDQAQLRTDITNNIGELGRFGAGSVSVETTTNSAKVTVSGLPMTSIRAGLTVGFKF